MNRIVVRVVLVVAVTTIATAVAGWALGAALGVLAALLVARDLHVRSVRERARLMSQVAGWQDADRPRSVSTHGLGQLREVAELLDRTGAQLDLLDRRLRADLPWRHEMVMALPQPAVLFGADGYMVAANSGARTMLGIPADGERTTLLAALGNAQLAGAVRRVQDHGGTARLDAEVGGRLLRADILAVGRQRLVLVKDRTRERRMEDVRRNFVVNASHELKTPATAIQALAEALVVTLRSDPARVGHLVEQLERESQRLIRLVHDLLDLRRMEDAVDVRRAVVDVVPVVNQAVEDIAAWAAEREVDVAARMPESASVLVDAEDLVLVVRNLLSNALQYNRPGGSVVVSVTDQDSVVIEVADTGIGIPKADSDRIFERFYRVDIARSRATGGTGLGLSMVRHAINRNGGTIEVDSLLGTGSVFRVRLPAAVVPRGRAPGEMSSGRAGGPAA